MLMFSISFEKFNLYNYVYMMSEYFTGMLILLYWLQLKYSGDPDSCLVFSEIFYIQE